MISGLVLLGVVTLVVLAWVDDRRREDEAAFAISRPAARRVVEEPYGRAPEPPADDASPAIVLPSEPEPAIDLEAPAAEQAPETETATATQASDPTGTPEKPPAPGPAGSWRIHTLHNGEGS